jgi:hypothetical protein
VRALPLHLSLPPPSSKMMGWFILPSPLNHTPTPALSSLCLIVNLLELFMPVLLMSQHGLGIIESYNAVSDGANRGIARGSLDAPLYRCQFQPTLPSLSIPYACTSFLMLRGLPLVPLYLSSSSGEPPPAPPHSIHDFYWLLKNSLSTAPFHLLSSVALFLQTTLDMTCLFPASSPDPPHLQSSTAVAANTVVVTVQPDEQHTHFSIGRSIPLHVSRYGRYMGQSHQILPYSL